MTGGLKISWGERAKTIGFMIFEEPVKVLDDVRINSSEIGAYTVINRRAELVNARVGRYTSIGPNTIVGAGDHPIDRLTTSPVSYGPQFSFFAKMEDGFEPFDAIPRVCIGNDVWIGANVVIRSGITIGDGAIVGAGAIVTKDVEPFTIVGGVPARVIRTRFPSELKNAVSDLSWWRYDLLAWRQNGSLPIIGSLNMAFVFAARAAIQDGKAPLIAGRRCLVDFRVQPQIMRRVPDDYSLESAAASLPAA